MRESPLRAAVLLVGLSLTLSSESLARSGRPVGLQGIEKLGVDVLLGGPLGIEPSVALELFGGDRDRADAFKRSTADSACRRLADAGFKASLGSELADGVATVDGWVALLFYGRPIEGDGTDSRYVFMVRVDGTREDLETSAGLVWTQSVIGVAADRDLEASMADAAEALLKQLIQAGE